MSSRLKYIILASLLFFSCSPRIIETVRTEIEYRDRVVMDSLYFRDSVWIKEKIKGDTVYLDKYVYKFVYRDKYRADTLIKEVHDTTAVEVKVEKPLSIAQKTKISAFPWLLGAVLLLLLWTFRKQIFKHYGKISFLGRRGNSDNL